MMGNWTLVDLAEKIESEFSGVGRNIVDDASRIHRLSGDVVITRNRSSPDQHLTRYATFKWASLAGTPARI